jgi:hypothetical protein
LSNFDILINIVAHEVILSDLLLSHYISSRWAHFRGDVMAQKKQRG